MSKQCQKGYVFKASSAWHVRYYTTVAGERTQKCVRLCIADRENSSKKSKLVEARRREVMDPINAMTVTADDLTISQFYENRFLSYCEEIVELTGRPRMKASTMRCYEHLWRRHLKPHFGTKTLQQYEAKDGTRFLQSLTSTQGKSVVKHVKALGTSIFKLALRDEILTHSVWDDVLMPDGMIASKKTAHYTKEEAEAIIDALKDYPDCQLVMGFACYLGLRPGEIAGLKWPDFNANSTEVTINRSVIRGVVDTPKTEDSVDTLPVIPQVKALLDAWKTKAGNPSVGYVFQSRNGTAIDLHNLVARTIKPVLKKAGLSLKGGLYAGRRSAATLVIEVTGNAAIAQALLRHASMKTTLDAYAKVIGKAAFRKGMARVDKAISARVSKAR
jgi:integrase